MTLYAAGLIFAILFLGVIYTLVARKVWHGESGLDGNVPPSGGSSATRAGAAWRAPTSRTGPFVLLFFAGALVAETTDAVRRRHGGARPAPCSSASSSTGASSCSTGRRHSCPRTSATSREPGRAAAAARPAGAPMSLFRRRKEPETEPASRTSRPVPALGVPFQRKGDAWLVEVGGGWATFGWVPRDATLVGFLEYEEAPGASTDSCAPTPRPDSRGTSPTATT